MRAGRAAQLRPSHPDGVELVEEHHARSPPPGRLEQVVELLLAVAQPHVEHVVEQHRDERGIELAGESPGEVRLAAARRSVQEHPATQATAELGAQLGHAQRAEEAQLEAALDVGQAGDVAEPDPPLLVLGDDVAEEGVELVELLPRGNGVGSRAAASLA